MTFQYSRDSSARKKAGQLRFEPSTNNGRLLLLASSGNIEERILYRNRLRRV